MAPVRYSLHYERYCDHLMSSFGKLLQTQSLVDMTLMCSSHTIRVHKLVLSASSVYFQEILQKQPGEPLIILKMKFGVLKCLVEFMYCGKTQCLEENVDDLVAAAQFLKIKGLSKVTRESLGITSTAELPAFTPPVVINRPPQSIIDLHAKDVVQMPKSQPTAALGETAVRMPGTPYMESGYSKRSYTDTTPYVRTRRGRPSYKRSAHNPSWESSFGIEPATEQALLRREQDSRNTIHQLKNLQSQNVQDYMNSLTLSQAVNSHSEVSKQSYIDIDNDLIYMDQTMSSSVLDSTTSCSKGTFSNESITASYSASSTTNASSSGDNTNNANNTMSQYVNALKNSGLPTNLPILFESGDGSYINVNEQVLQDMVQSREIQYEVIEQQNLMEGVPDLNEIKSIDDLSKSIERGEVLLGGKSLNNEASNFCKDNNACSEINDLNQILPDNLDAFNEQTNYVDLENNLSHINSIQNDNNNDLSCIDNDLHFFTKSMSDDVKKYYEGPNLSDGREMDQYCPVSTALDTTFSMSLLDTKSMQLSEPMNEAYPSDLSRNDTCFTLEHQLPNPSDFKDETLDFLISTPKRIDGDTNYDAEKQSQERNNIIKDLMSMEMNINNNDKTDAFNITTDELNEFLDNTDPEKSNTNKNVTTSVISPADTQNNEQETTTLDQTVLPESKNCEDSFEDSIKAHILDKKSVECKDISKNKDIKKGLQVPQTENIPFAVGLLPLPKISRKEDTIGGRKRKNQAFNSMHDIDAKCLKRRTKNK
ncbi:broad-complex core protein isoforms 1/2/3/4/5-like, partial [Aricia agestis]|uniref:broad-complex core protein isoforms 1/2/3/4/5-like n=1 Tax=Aricia agestis TaxID=91739 RepID=UPI001C20943C